MGRQLNTTVVVTPKPGPGDAGFLVLGPGDDVPDWAAEQIGDHAWVDDGEAAPAEQPEPPVDLGLTPPAKAGPTASKEAWVAYAAAHSVTVPDDATRDGIIAALDAAGIPTAATPE